MEWKVTKVQTNNGLKLKMTTKQEGSFIEEEWREDWLTEEEAKNRLEVYKEKLNLEEIHEEDKIIPFIGIIAKCGFAEWYDELKAEDADYHHNYCMSDEGLEKYDDDDTLRFSYDKKENEISILGEPALEPYIKGRGQMKQMATLLMKNGLQGNVNIRVEQHYLNTPYEGAVIGTLAQFR